MAKRATVSTITIRAPGGARAQAPVARVAQAARYGANVVATRRAAQPSRAQVAAIIRRPPARPADHTAAAECAALRADARALDAQRRALGFTLATLAQRLGVSATTVGRILRDDATTQPPDAASRERQRQRLSALRLALNASHSPTPWTATTATTATTAPTATTAARPRAHQPQHRPASAATAPVAVAVAALPDAPTYRVLIVEDDPDVVAIYQLTLAEAANDDADRAARYDVTVAPTATTCLAALRAAHTSGRPYDLLLMDLGLRDINAHHADYANYANYADLADHDAQVAHANVGARDDAPTWAGDDLLTTLVRSRLPLPRARLVVSGMAPYHLQRAQQGLQRLGASYLAKPFDIDVLLTTVYNLCALPSHTARGLTELAATTPES